MEERKLLHDLRNQLTVIYCVCQILSEQPSEELGVVVNASTTMAHLIDDYQMELVKRPVRSVPSSQLAKVG